MPQPPHAGVPALFRHAAGVALVALVVATAAVPAATVIVEPAAQPVAAADAASRVIGIARAQVGDPWRYGATGPSSFDCSGLVTYAFRNAGQLARIGDGRYRSASALYGRFQRRGLTSRRGGRVGDLVVYGGGSHVGIYLGNGRVVSTLLSGVRVHGLTALHQSFTAFLHTGLSGRAVPHGVRRSTTHHPEAAPASARRERRAAARRAAARRAVVRRAAIRQERLRRLTVARATIPTWSGASLGPTAAAADLGPAAFERAHSDPTGMIAREVARERGTWLARVAAQDGVTGARVSRIRTSTALSAQRVAVGADRAWVLLATGAGRTTWVASQVTRR